MDVNLGEPWSEMDIQDLRASLDFGNTVCGRGEHALQGRRRGPPESERAWADRAPKKMVTRQAERRPPKKSPAEAGQDTKEG